MVSQLRLLSTPAAAHKAVKVAEGAKAPQASSSTLDNQVATSMLWDYRCPEKRTSRMLLAQCTVVSAHNLWSIIVTNKPVDQRARMCAWLYTCWGMLRVAFGHIERHHNQEGRAKAVSPLACHTPQQ